MNWSEIAEKYPKANDAWWKYYYETEFDVEISAWIDDERPDSLIGPLLAFFDGQEIYVFCLNVSRIEWWSEIHIHTNRKAIKTKIIWSDGENLYSSRQRAIEIAFIKAFGLLEKR